MKEKESESVVNGIPFEALKHNHCHYLVGTDAKGDSLYCGKLVFTRKPPRCKEHDAMSRETEAQVAERLERRQRNISDQLKFQSAEYAANRKHVDWGNK